MPYPLPPRVARTVTHDGPVGIGFPRQR
jgi:hypothetical protein